MLEYAQDLVLNVYWADHGNEDRTRPETADGPVPALAYRKMEEPVSGEEDGFVVLETEHLQELCLEEMPSVERTDEGDCMTFFCEGTSLPSKIEETAGDGQTSEWEIQWKYVLPVLEGYDLTEVTEEDLGSGEYAYADQGAGWYYVLQEEALPAVEAGVRADSWSEDLELEVYWADLPGSETDRPDSEGFPEVELAFAVEMSADGTEGESAGEEQILTDDNKDQVGLEELPDTEAEEIRTAAPAALLRLGGDTGEETEASYTVQKYRLTVPGGSLPSRITETKEDGGEISGTVAWKMILPQVDGYTLLNLTEDMLENDPQTYFFALEKGPGMYYAADLLLAGQMTMQNVGTEPEETTEITQYWNEISIPVHWLDNNNEAGKRPEPDTFSYYEIQYQVTKDGVESEWISLTEETWAGLGLSEDTYPKPTLTETGTGEWLYKIENNVLPSVITTTDVMGVDHTMTLEWQVVPKEVSGYELTNSYDLPKPGEPPYDVQPEKNTGWYYVLLTDFTFDFDIRQGELGLQEEVMEQVLTSLNFKAEWGKDGVVDSTLKAIENRVTISYDKDKPSTGTVTIGNLPKYYYDGSRVSYKVYDARTEEGVKGIIDLSSLGKDFFAFRFDNTNVATVGSDEENLHDGGSLILTLTGTTDYEARKIWLDAAEEDKSGRPTLEFELWRYRAGSDYTTAAPVRGTDGQILKYTLENNSSDVLTIKFCDSDGEPASLEKYDPEGYPYIYVMREYMTGGENAYEQVMGEVQKDGSVEDFVLVMGEDGDLEKSAERESGNGFIYCYINEDDILYPGTISNRLTGSENTSVVKTWEASVFQTEFEDVSVELTLQVRPKGDQESSWEDVETVRMKDFYAEHLTDTASASAPLYGDFGEALEYRWIETGVYQGEDSDENLLQEDDRSFVLIQDGKEIRYQSVVTKPKPGENQTVITNSIRDTIGYEVEKIWLDGEGNPTGEEHKGEEITFGLYRAISGKAPDYSTPLYRFTMDGITDSKETILEASVEGDEDYQVTVKETKSWYAVVDGLPEYDETGQLYEYFLLETNGVSSYFPSYKTSWTEDGNYLTTVTNAPGKGHHIIVQKYWTDGSDIDHREPVTLEVYSREDNELIAKTTLENGIWNQWVGIGTYKPDEVYIVETKVGDHETDYRTENGAPIATTDDKGDSVSKAVHQFEGSNHKYEATYRREQLTDVNGTFLYSVTNRRLGDVNITVTKEWLDGDRSMRKKLQEELEKINTEGGESTLRLMLRLDFGPDSPETYTMTWGDAEGDTINLGGTTGDTISNQENGTGENGKTLLEIDLDEPESKYYFTSLPKYDVHGDVASYVVEEVWVDKDNKIVSNETLQKKYPQLWDIYSEYLTTTDSSYSVGEGTLHASDTQTVKITNRLSGTKNVSWKKVWNDEYTYGLGERPDIYLDVYQLRHTEHSDDQTELTLFQEHYRWTQDPENPDDTYRNWEAYFNGLPKYDEYGYEIFYYAVERIEVDAGSLGYQEVAYSVPEEGTWETETSLGTMTQPAEAAKTDGSVYLIPAGEGTEPAEYVLKEGNMFTNSIRGETKVTVTKQWINMPGLAPYKDLPKATFYLYRGTTEAEATENAGKDTDRDQAEAWLTVENTDWQALFANGTYTFDFLYRGKNSLNTEGETIPTVPEGSAAGEPAKLEKFSEDGELYHYVLVEDVDDPAEDGEQTYKSPEIAGYTAGNVYESTEGSLSFRKWLELPSTDDGTVYPAVEFEISRTYTKNDNTTQSEPETVKVRLKEDATGNSYVWEKADDGRNLIWSSEQVEAKAFDSSQTGGDALVTGVFVVEGLEKYAPNGSVYTYTVREVKTELNGYSTWVVKKNVTDNVESIMNDTYLCEDSETPEVKVDSLTVSLDSSSIPVSGTFINARSDEQEGQTLQGRKIWEDLGDELGIRPDDITLTVKRSAPSQTGQGNKIEETLVVNDDYIVEWPDTDSDTWTYKITGLGDRKLDRYAPNGMEWQYTVTEDLDGIPYYEANPADGTVGEEGVPNGSGVQMMKDLTNSITKDVIFRKTWVDEDGDEITEDYLGEDLSVTFELQVKAENGSYQSADTFFADQYSTIYEKIKEENNITILTWTVTDRINGPEWDKEYSFKALPLYVNDDEGNIISLSYRVVETSIGYGESIMNNIKVEEEADSNGYTYEFEAQNPLSSLFQPYYPKDNQNSNNPEGGIHRQYNRLVTAEFSVTKTWAGDSNNKYNTRTESDAAGYDWMTTFVIQRAAVPDPGETPEEGDWEIVADGAGLPLTVTVYGNDSIVTANRSVSDLPEYGLTDENELVSYQYRARELKPLSAGDKETGYTMGNIASYIVSNNDTYADTYTAAYTDIRNETTVTNTMKSTEVYAEKKWQNNGGHTPETSFTLQYLKADGKNGTWSNVIPVETVNLDGTANPELSGQGYWEYEGWKAKWTGLPEVMPGSLRKDGKTQYQVTEPTLTGYHTVPDTGSAGTSTDPFEITNTMVTSLTVRKVWKTQTGQEKQVTVELWRTTGTIGDAQSKQVLDANGNPVTVDLNSTNNWTHTFSNLPEYDGNTTGANKYIYYAREVQIGTGTEAGAVEISATAQNDIYTGTDGGATDYRVIHVQGTDNQSTTIYNIGRTDLTGTKTWKDNGDAYGTRPKSLTLKLYRTTTPDNDDSWEEVEETDLTAEHASFAWTDTDGDEWTYQYSGLLYADSEGDVYTYRVKEEDVPEEYDSVQTGNDITNTLSDVLDITVTKQWEDGSDQDGLRPESVTLTLYQNGVKYQEAELKAGNLLQQLFGNLTGSGNAWSYTFKNLPEYDGNGVRYEYTVKEDQVPSGYLTDGTAQGSAAEGFTVTNTLTTNVDVQKLWRGTEPGDEGEVVVGLYRKSEGTPEEPAAVRGTDGRPLTLALNEGNGWQAAFTDLPRFDGEGRRYLYEVREETVGGIPVEESGFVIHVKDEQNDGTFSCQIINVPETEISGTKTWLDNHNAGGTRPETLELKIYRSTEDGEEEEVTAEILEADGAVLAWTGTDTDVWTYTCSGLPVADDEGRPYTYRVEEVVPSGYASRAEGGDFTNTLTAEVDIFITKRWEDNSNSGGKRPEKIELILYANGTEVRRVNLAADTGGLETLWNRLTAGTDNTWEYVFEGLPRYDEYGAEITYTVQEVVPEGYSVRYEEGTNSIINKKRSSGSSGSSEDENAGMTVSTTAVRTGPVKTGDGAQAWLWSASAVLSAACITASGVYLYRRRKKTK